MKYFTSLLILLNFLTMIAQKTVHEFEIVTIDGEKKSLSTFKGKKMLFVNTASECGFTPQYKELQQLHDNYGDKLVIIGFPANNFGGQEPGSNTDIKTFCMKNYGVTFLMANKVSVKGNDIDPMFNWLNQQKNDSFKGDIMWNFEKYLIDENGMLIKRFRSTTKPNSSSITKLI
jgi:glutathione peroxidase